jgi:hypothetical protein
MDTNIDSSMRSRRSHLRRVQSGFIVRNVSVSNSIGIATTNINGNTTANPSIHTNANMERKREGCNVEIS